MTGTSLQNSYEKTLSALAQACASCGRSPDEVKLVAVSKFHSADAIARVADAGQVDFGENYMQEAMEKREALAEKYPHLRWHFIGHLQSRKARAAAGNFSLIHTLDSSRLAAALEKHLAESGKNQPVLIEVNIGGEPQKSGAQIAELSELAEYTLAHCPHLQLRGLMCMPPVFDSGEAARPYFAKLRNLRDKLAVECKCSLPELSMGMSGDFAAAVKEGATIVRIGTDIFGPRPPKL